MKKLYAFLKFAMVAVSMQAANYYVTPSATKTGDIIWFRHQAYTVGTNCFATIKAALAANPAANSYIFVGPGTYSDAVTVSVEGLKLYGANSYQDPRCATRTNPSIITGRMTINANSVIVNGFNFTGAGQVYNNTATKAAPLSTFKFIYNVVESSTLTSTKNVGVVKLGTVVDDANAPTAAVQAKYVDITVSHNIFKGAATPQFVQIAGASGTTSIDDNKFTSGANSIRLDNATGTVNIRYNKFADVGTANEASGGNFCVSINRSAYSGTNVFNILGNDFNNCIGQTSLYPVIRFYTGEEGATDCVLPKGCSVNVKNNVFRNKKKIHADYNYVYYANKGTGADIKTDISGNSVDDRTYCFAWCKSANSGALERFYGDSYASLNPSRATFGTHKAAVTTQAVTVLQSFDYDPKSGDYFYIQLDNSSRQTTMKSKYGDPKSLRMSHYIASSASWSHVDVVWGGHGTNMATCRIGGQLYIFGGGNATLKADGSETRSDGISWFRYIGGSTVDLRKSSFTYNGTSYPIKTYVWSGHTNVYPAVDEVSRLLALRSTSGTKNYYAIFDLDDFLADPANATILRNVTITKGDDATTTSGDKGYNTWDNQGFTISGDFLYVLEGVGTENSAARNGKPTIVVHCYNWRTKKFTYRKFMTQSTLLGLTHGEPEGIKIRRNSAGNAEMLIGVAVGASGARKAAIYKWTPKADDSAAGLSSATHTADVSSITFNGTNLTDPLTQTVTVTNATLHGNVKAVCSGSNVGSLSVSTSKTNPWNLTTTATVTYKPNKYEPSAQGYLRVSSPMASDLVIPITIKNSAASAIEDLEAEQPEANDTPVQYFNLQGQRLDKPQPGQLVIKRTGIKAEKVIYQ